MRTSIPLGEWLPDMPDFQNPGCEVADNVRPTVGGYEPFNSLVGTGETVTGAVKGARQFYDNSGNSVLVGGTDDRLFIRRSSITQTTGLTSIGSGEAWDFAQFNDFVVATAVGNAPQYLTDIDSDNTWSALTGSPPNAKRCARVGDFLMLGNMASNPTRIQWSHFNAPASSWTASRLTQAGYVDLPYESGAVQKIAGGRYALVFQERAIRRLSYVGPPIVFKEDPVTTERGAVAPFSVVQLGYQAFFLSQDGFYVTNGTSVDPIGGRRVNRWFFDTVEQSEIRNVHGAIDWQNQCIVWAFSSGGSGNDRLLIYNYIEDKWASATVAVGWLVSTSIDGIDLEGLDAVYGNLDAIPLSLDSPEFKTKNRRLAAFVDGASTSEYSIFNGDPLEATWETGEIEYAYINAARPIMLAEDWNAKFTLLMRDHKNRQTTSLEKECGWDGWAPVRGEGVRVSIRMVKPSGEWTEATGIRLRAQERPDR